MKINNYSKNTRLISRKEKHILRKTNNPIKHIFDEIFLQQNKISLNTF